MLETTISDIDFEHLTDQHWNGLIDFGADNKLVYIPKHFSKDETWKDIYIILTRTEKKRKREDIIKRIEALPENERIEVIKVIWRKCETLEYIDNFLKKESAEERQKRSEAGNKHEEISLVTPEEMGRKYG